MRTIDADALVAQWEVDAEQVEDFTAKMFIYGATVDVKNAPTIEPEPHWIPCSERLPEEGTECLVTLLSYAGIPVISIDSYDYDGQDGWFTYMDRVVAWMPLPAPYREDGTEGGG